MLWFSCASFCMLTWCATFHLCQVSGFESFEFWSISAKFRSGLSPCTSKAWGWFYKSRKTLPLLVFKYSFVPFKILEISWVVAAHAFSPSTWEEKAGRSLNSRSAWSIKQVLRSQRERISWKFSQNILGNISLDWIFSTLFMLCCLQSFPLQFKYNSSSL